MEALSCEQLQQRRVERPPDAAAMVSRVDIHGHVGAPSVRRPLGGANRLRKCGHLAFLLGHQPWMGARDSLDPPGQLVRVRGLFLERDDGVAHVRGVYRRAASGVSIRIGVADQHGRNLALAAGHAARPSGPASISALRRRRCWGPVTFQAAGITGPRPRDTTLSTRSCAASIGVQRSPRRWRTAGSSSPTPPSHTARRIGTLIAGHSRPEIGVGGASAWPIQHALDAGGPREGGTGGAAEIGAELWQVSGSSQRAPA